VTKWLNKLFQIYPKEPCQQCYICGDQYRFPRARDTNNLRETVICKNCRGTKRQIDVAQVLLKIIESSSSCLARSERDINKFKIYILESYGPIYEMLSKTANVICSEYWENVPTGTLVDNVRCEDVQNLTFSNESFDIVISQDIFEHIPSPEVGFKEIYRILKPGVYHIFTIPYNKNLSNSQVRAYIKQNEIVHILPPVYHGDMLRPKGILVYTDFGLDFEHMLERIGFKMYTFEHNNEKYQGGSNTVFISKK
jgi:hypothetical protein